MSKTKKEVTKKDCKGLKAKLKKLRSAWETAEKAEAIAERKYKKKYKKIKELIKASKDEWRATKVKSNRKRKAYLKAKKQLKQDCLPTPAAKEGVWKEVKEKETAAKAKIVKVKKAAKEKVKVEKKTSPKKAKQDQTKVVPPILPKVKADKKAKTTKKAKKKTSNKKTLSKSSLSTVWGADEKAISTQNGLRLVAKSTASKTPEPKPTKPLTTTSSKSTAAAKAGVKDNLKRIEGIGPKIESLLQAAGISTFEQLSESKEERLREILLAEGPRYRIHNPATWPKQASFAAKGNWEELKKWQDELKGGREV